MDEVNTYLCFGLMVQTSSVCECLEGEMDLIPYLRLKQESWWALVWGEISGSCFALGKKIWDQDSG